MAEQAGLPAPPRMVEVAPQPDDEILTVKEVARLLKLSTSTIYLLANSGKLPSVRIGASYRFKRRAILAMIDKGA